MPLVRSPENVSFIFKPSKPEMFTFHSALWIKNFFPLHVCTFSCTAKKKRDSWTLSFCSKDVSQSFGVLKGVRHLRFCSWQVVTSYITSARGFPSASNDHFLCVDQVSMNSPSLRPFFFCLYWSLRVFTQIKIVYVCGGVGIGIGHTLMDAGNSKQQTKQNPAV